MARDSVFSTTSCIEAGKRLVQQFIETYKKFSPGGQLFMERLMLSNFTMNDFLLGVMVLCLVVHTPGNRASQESGIDVSIQSKVLSLLEQSYAICAEKSIACRDARRVSRTNLLTLNGAKRANESVESMPQPLQLSPTV